MLSHSANAQDAKPDTSKQLMYNHSVHGSLGIGGLLFLYIPATIYYEHMIQKDLFGPKITSFIDAGFGYAGSWDGDSPFLIARFGILTGKRKHHFESSVGIAHFLDPFYGLTPSLAIGYRKQKPKSRSIFRTGVGWPEAIYVGWGVGF